LTVIGIGLVLRCRLRGLPLTGKKRYSYVRPGLAVKSSVTKLCMGWLNVVTLVVWSGWGITERKTFELKVKNRSSSFGLKRSTANPKRPLVSASSKSMPNDTVLVPVTANT
jgi:hypothetical protein